MKVQNIAICESKNFQYDENRNPKVVIFNDEIKSLKFYEFFELIQKYSSKVITKKELQPLVYQQPRKQNPLSNTFNQDNNLFKENYVSLITLDYDDGITTRQEIEDKLKDFKFISYNSWSNGLKPNRFRILLSVYELVEWDKYIDCKQELIKYFGCAKESFSSGLMYLPCNYEGIRNPELSFNDGIEFDLYGFISKVSTEKDIRKETRTIINENITRNNEYNSNRQSFYINKVIDKLNSTSVGNGLNNAIQSCIGTLSHIGLTNSEIEDIILPYESNKSKINNWCSWIAEKNELNEKITYFNRYEYKNFKDESYIFDNKEQLFYDSITDKWLIGKPRNNNKTLLKKCKTDILFNYIYEQIDNLKIAEKLYSFIKLLDKDLDRSILIKIDKYEQPIIRGVRYKRNILRTFLFDYLKLKEVIKDKKTTDLTSIFDIIIDKDDLQTRILKCIKNLMWVRAEKCLTSNGFGFSYWFSFKPLCDKLLIQSS